MPDPLADERIIVDPSQPAAEAVAMLEFLSALIHPESKRKRKLFIEAALAYGARMCRKHDDLVEPVWASSVISQVKLQQQTNRLRSAERILFRRLLAARMYQTLALAKGRMTLRQAANRCNQNASHVVDKVWKQSKPVLHLAVGLLLAAPQQHDDDDRPLLLFLIARSTWALAAIEKSEKQLRFMSTLAKNKKLIPALRNLPLSGRVRVVTEISADC